MPFPIMPILKPLSSSSILLDNFTSYPAGWIVVNNTVLSDGLIKMEPPDAFFTVNSRLFLANFLNTYLGDDGTGNYKLGLEWRNVNGVGNYGCVPGVNMVNFSNLTVASSSYEWIYEDEFSLADPVVNASITFRNISFGGKAWLKSIYMEIL